MDYLHPFLLWCLRLFLDFKCLKFRKEMSLFTSSADNNKTIDADIGHSCLEKCILFFTSIHPLWNMEHLSTMDQIRCRSTVFLILEKAFS